MTDNSGHNQDTHYKKEVFLRMTKKQVIVLSLLLFCTILFSIGLLVVHNWFGYWVVMVYENYDKFDSQCEWMLEKLPLILIGKGVLRAGSNFGSYIVKRGKNSVPYFASALKDDNYPSPLYDIWDLQEIGTDLIPLILEYRLEIASHGTWEALNDALCMVMKLSPRGFDLILNALDSDCEIIQERALDALERTMSVDEWEIPVEEDNVKKALFKKT